MSPRPDISFNALVVTLATSAAVHLGDATDPNTGRTPPPNAEAAGHMVDLIALLAEKTRGNLEPAEEQFLTRVLSELRMRLLEVQRSAGPAGER